MSLRQYPFQLTEKEYHDHFLALCGRLSSGNPPSSQVREQAQVIFNQFIRSSKSRQEFLAFVDDYRPEASTDPDIQWFYSNKQKLVAIQQKLSTRKINQQSAAIATLLTSTPSELAANVHNIRNLRIQLQDIISKRKSEIPSSSSSSNEPSTVEPVIVEDPPQVKLFQSLKQTHLFLDTFLRLATTQSHNSLLGMLMRPFVVLF